jgi:hypothetical protein
VTQDGFQHVNDAQGDVFVMGKETDDWGLKGKEVIGSENLGETIKTGNDIEAGESPVLPKVGAQKPDGATIGGQQLPGSDQVSQIADLIKQLQAILGGGQAPAANDTAPAIAPGEPTPGAPADAAAAGPADAAAAPEATAADAGAGTDSLSQAMSMIAEMLKIIEQFSSMLQGTRRDTLAA